MNKVYLVILLSSFLLAIACKRTNSDQAGGAPSDTTALAPPAPDWAKNATIYEVNIRQFSPQGTFKAVEAQLARLKELGIDIVWLMPIFPTTHPKNPGAPGSIYTITDYQSVNPEYGTMADFKSLVKRAHALGLRVILDWVPSHTGNDHPWLQQHPDWYLKAHGKVTAPIDPLTGKPAFWPDAAGLDYSNPALRKAMTEAMQFWVKEYDIDGYRCNVAGYVPNSFWATLRPALDKIKTVFMLAEWEDDPEQFKACFNMNYGWAMHSRMKAIAEGARPANSLDTLREANQKRFPSWYYQMLFTQNHDENTNNGTLEESFGPGADAFVVLCSTLEGMPLVYNGMEANLNKRLSLFEKDTIAWGNYSKSDFFKTLLTLKHRNRALWNGLAGGPAIKIITDHDDKVYAFHRQHESDQVVVVLNLSETPQTCRLEGDGYAGMYTEIFSHQQVELKPQTVLTLKPWEYRVFTN